MANKEYLELVKRLSGPLAAYCIDANDLDTKTLNNCDKLLKGIAVIAEKRDEHLDALKHLTYSFENIAEACGMNRRTLSENETYSKIISFHYEGYAARTNDEIRELRIQLDKYKKNEKDMEEKLNASLSVKTKLAFAEAEKERLRREKEYAEEDLAKEKKEKEEAQRRLLELQHIIDKLSASGSS